MRKMKVLLLYVLIIGWITGCNQQSIIENELETAIRVVSDSGLEIYPIIPEVGNERIPEEIRKREVTLTAVGDIMFHEWQLKRAYDYETDTFDFSHAFHYINHYLEAADYTMGNLETTFGGANGSYKSEKQFNLRGYTCFPYFNTPDILATNLKAVGFDLLSTANNHSLDSRSIGLKRTLDILDDINIDHVGTYRTLGEQQEPFIKDINGITFGFGAYTYATNGLPLPKDEPYVVNTLDMFSEDKIEKMAEEVKVLSGLSEMVVVYIHFGEEYQYFPNRYQKEIVNILFDAGADIILGSHPHVLQPIEIRKIEKNGVERTGVVIYSLGNFVSSQRYNAKRPKHTDIGLILDFQIEKYYSEAPVIREIILIPTYTYWSTNEISVLPVFEIYENLQEHPVKLTQYEQERLSYAYNEIVDHLTIYLEDEYITEYKEYKYHIRIHEE